MDGTFAGSADLRSLALAVLGTDVGCGVWALGVGLALLTLFRRSIQDLLARAVYLRGWGVTLLALPPAPTGDDDDADSEPGGPPHRHGLQKGIAMNAREDQPTEPGAVEALVENHRRFLSFLERRVGDRETAEEILQAAFVRGIERADEIRDEDRAVAWFYRLLRRAVVDHWRARDAERRGVEAFAWEIRGDAGPTPELTRELCRCFEPLLPTLKPEYEEILRRVDLEEMRPVDFAAHAGITPNNAMVRLHRARHALRRQMTLSCRTCADHGCLDCSCGSPSRPEV